MGDAYGYVPILKFTKTDEGTLIVEGPATDSNIDRDRQIADPAWLSKAMPAWYKSSGNIREQHDGKRAVGTAVHYEQRDNGQHWIKAEVVDPIAITKVEKKVLRGFSFGARNARVEVDKAASGGRIVDGDIFEVSLVDRPANPNCMFTVAKADGGGDLQVVEEPELVEVEKKYSPTEFAELLKGLGKNGTLDKADTDHPMFGDELTKAVKQAERDEMAKTGVAMPNGDFPIPDKGHLRSAIGRLVKYTGDKAAAKKHIIKRARALGQVAMLPDDWNIAKAIGVLDQVRTLVPSLVVMKDDGSAFDPTTEAGDIDNAMAAISCIARLIISEAEGLAAGRMEEIWDIQTLASAACGLQYFVQCESQQEVELSMSDTKADKADKVEAGQPATTTDVTKTDTETTKTDTASTDTGDLTKTDMSDLLKAAIAEATTPLKDELALMKADVAKVLGTPQSGGPARMRTTTQSAVASKADGYRREITLCQAQIQVTGGDLQKGYRERLATAETELNKLDGTA